MALESATYVNDFVTTNPVGLTDPKSQGDDHIRLIKTVLQGTFPGFAGRFGRVQAKSSAYTVLLTDNSSVFILSGAVAWTLNLTAAATLGNGFLIFLVNDGGMQITIDPNSTEQINGSSTYVLGAYARGILFCDGSAFYVMTFSQGDFATGDVKLTYATTAAAGWVLMNDGSIGSAASSATTRANADTEALYTLFWTNVIDTWAPVSSGRGASAAADFAANKRLTLPRALGRALAASGAGSGLTSRALGQYLGLEGVSLIEAELPPHTHTYDRGYEITGTLYASGTINAPLQDNASQNTGSTGSGQAHYNMQPSTFLNVMVKL